MNRVKAKPKMRNVIRLSEIGEFPLIARLVRALPAEEGIIVGPGDDCAVVECDGATLLLTCDAAIEGIHFRRQWAGAAAIGWKSGAAALSDIAAMGGRPRFMLITLACPPDEDVAFLEALYHGLSAAAAHCGAVIVGGDTTRSPSGVMVDIAVVGEAVGPRILRRTGARPGDLLAVTGRPGQAAAALSALQRSLDPGELAQAHFHPLPRILEGQWFAAHDGVHAMIDLSDGLLQDAGHLAEAAWMGVDVDPDRIPVSDAMRHALESAGEDPAAVALSGGEDYELIIAVEPADFKTIQTDFQERFELPLTVVGNFTSEWQGARVRGIAPKKAGYDHFKG